MRVETDNRSPHEGPDDEEEATMATQTPVRPARPAAIPTQRQAPTAREHAQPSVRVGEPLAPRRSTYRVVAPRRQAVRLTRRGRLLLLVSAVLLTVLTLVVLRPGGPAFAGDGDRGPATRTVVVQHGQTLWQIARDIRPDADPRVTVQRIQELNGLTTAQVWAGQPLVVPS